MINVYKFHTAPTTLIATNALSNRLKSTHNNADGENVTNIAFDLYANGDTSVLSYLKAHLYDTIELAIPYEVRIPELESDFINSSVIAGSLDAVFGTSTLMAYCEFCVQERWPEAEKVLMKIPADCVQYAEEILKHRWLAAEPIIKQDMYAAKDYQKAFGITL